MGKNLTDSIKSLKGMLDVLPQDVYMWQYLEDNLRVTMRKYGYDEIRFPILEKSQLFIRTIGDTTDIVEKEMFTFQDKDKQATMISMRPEGTASCVRACCEHDLLRNNQQQRLWYTGPMFRRENPQKGRYRQFTHFGVESFGFNEPAIEAEHIAIAFNLWKSLGLLDDITLEINSIGSLDARQKYQAELKKYFSANIASLDEDSMRRLDENPLRILDSKNEAMQPLLDKAPKILDFLDDESKDYFDGFKQHLKNLRIPFVVNSRIVRGLDYYNGVVYEWVTDKLGSQSAVGAGGRYDSLSNNISGISSYGVGFAIGMERVLLLLKSRGVEYKKNIDCYLMAIGDKAEAQALIVAESLRNVMPDVAVMTNIGGGNFKTQFKRADRSGAKYALILGEDEMTESTLSIKFLREEKEQLTVAMEDVAITIGELL